MSAFTAGGSGLLGKVPTRAEYLPVPTTAPSFAAFDGWLTDATEWAAARAGAAWRAAFGAGAMYGFAYRPAGSASSLLCGALTPSHDSAGRQFPLALAAPLELAPTLVSRPELLPFVLEGVWGDATQGLSDVREGGDSGGPPALPSRSDLSGEEAAELYEQWASSLPLSELWQLLGPALGNPIGTLRILLETLRPVRGAERPETTLCLRLPLGMAGGAALCFWIDVVRRWAGWRATVPSLFWSHDGSDGMALLVLGSPPKDALAELWLPTGAREQIADFTVLPSDAVEAACGPLPANVEEAARTGQAPVAILLQALLA